MNCAARFGFPRLHCLEFAVLHRRLRHCLGQLLLPRHRYRLRLLQLRPVRRQSRLRPTLLQQSLPRQSLLRRRSGRRRRHRQRQRRRLLQAVQPVRCILLQPALRFRPVRLRQRLHRARWHRAWLHGQLRQLPQRQRRLLRRQGPLRELPCVRRGALHGPQSGCGSSQGGFQRKAGTRGGCRRSSQRRPVTRVRPGLPWPEKCCL